MWIQLLEELLKTAKISVKSNEQWQSRCLCEHLIARFLTSLSFMSMVFSHELLWIAISWR